MCWCKVGGGGAGERKTVDEEETKYNNDASQDAPPEPLVHGSLDVLLALHEVLHCKVQRVQRPDVESSQGSRQRQDYKQNKRSSIIRADGERRDSVYDTKNKVSHGQPAYDGHGLAERGFDDSIAHADDEQQEERERVAEGVQHSDDDHKHLGSNIVAMAILVVVKAPSHKHLHHQEDQNGCDVVLYRQYIVSVLVVQEAPEQQDYKVYDRDATVEGELRNLRRWKLAVRVTERDDRFVIDFFGVGSGSDAVVSCLDRQSPLSAGDRVVDRLRVVEMDGFSPNIHVGNRVGVVSEDPFALVCPVAELRADGVVVADVGALLPVSLRKHMYSWLY